MSDSDNGNSLDGVAIVGMSGIFPGANSIDDYWRNLHDAVESIKGFSDEELLAAGVESDVLKDRNYVKAGATVEGIDMFDASFFGYTPREAEIIDPQHRMFLECAWHALEDAGYDPEGYDGSIAIFAGTGLNTYFLSNLITSPEVTRSVGGLYTLVGSDKDHLTTRVSYKLNLKGPSLTVQTACSSSLVAVFLGCQNLLNYGCDMALAGGVRVTVPQGNGYYFQEGGINSPDGHCRAFDAEAGGTVGGNGVGIVVLKRLDDAVADGDHIYAVIKGSAINNDGSLKVGYTAPGVNGQTEVVVMAQAVAGVGAETISYIEAHGTGTEIGDPIEIAALTQAFRQTTDKRQFCAIGSVKTNIGHLDAAAGVAGLIKAALALHHKEIPASLHYRRANPKIDFERSPFYVNTKLQKWETNGIPRRAGVSSFGIGGTNAHVILEEAPEREESGEGREWELILVSARSEEGVEAASEKLAEAIGRNEGIALRDVAYTLKVGRRAFDRRKAVVCRTVREAEEGLRGIDGDRVIRGEGAIEQRRLVMMFSGQGEQRRGMFKSLYERDGVFRKEMERCGEIARETSGLDLIEVLYGDGPDRGEEEIERTEVGQVAIYAVEYALGRMWESRGLEAEVVIGHSLGEYVAATIAGVMEVEQGVRLVSRRGEMMSRVGEGAMTAVWMSEEEADEKVEKWERRGEEISVAAVNGERLCVMSGRVRAIEELERELIAARVMWKRLRVKQAYHSEMMRGVAEEMREMVEGEGLREPKKEMISSVTGKRVRGEVARGKYWEEQTVRRVRFKECVEEAGRGGEVAMLEVGPGEVLSGIAREVLGRGSEVMASVGKGEKEEEWVEKVIGKMWVSGVGVNWKRSYEGEKRRRERLPGYGFEGKRYWVERRKVEEGERRKKRRGGVEEWIYVPVWKQSVEEERRGGREGEGTTVMLVGEEIGERLAEELRREGEEVVVVRRGEEYERVGEKEYEVRGDREEDYERMVRDIGGGIKRVVHMWCMGEGGLEEGKREGFYSLIGMAQALGRVAMGEEVEIEVVTSGIQEITGEEELKPERAMVMGPCRVIPQEYGNLKCRSIDVEYEGRKVEEVVKQLKKEVERGSEERVVGYRGKKRWVQRYERVETHGQEAVIREGGVYVITGGTGGIGQEVGKYLRKEYRAKVALISRRGKGAEEEVKEWGGESGEVMIEEADVSKKEQMREVIEKVKRKLGRINGVIHAAGTIKEGGMSAIEEMTREGSEEQFKAKVKGVRVLAEVMEGEGVDFCVLISSLSSVLGGLGFAAYAGGNVYMDSYAAKQNRKGGEGAERWISINLDGWRGGERKGAEEEEEMVIRGREVVEVVEKAVRQRGQGQVVVSVRDLGTRINEWVRIGEKKKEKEREELKKYVRPEMGKEYRGASTAVEIRIVEIWEELLGIEGVGVDDNFFELGGHSLLATQVTSRLREAFKLDIPLRSTFEKPTISKMSSAIEELLLNEIEELSEEEAQHLLNDSAGELQRSYGSRLE